MTRPMGRTLSSHTMGHQANGVFQEEVHILKVTNNTVDLESGSMSNGFFQKVGNSLPRPIPSSSHGASEHHIGPPPPSPPASVERFEEEYAIPAPSKIQISSVTPRPTGSMQRASRLPHGTGQSTGTPLIEASGSQSAKPPYQSPDGRLQPPPVPRPTRRNTTGSATPRTHHSFVQHANMHHAYVSPPFAYEDGDVEELESDIQIQAEQIRRERNSKRVKAQQAEAALTRSASRAENDQVLVGNLIGEDHVNYVLMYNMLTGIRIAVSNN